MLSNDSKPDLESLYCIKRNKALWHRWFFLSVSFVIGHAKSHEPFCQFGRFAELQGRWENPQKDEMPPVQSFEEQCPEWAKDRYNCDMGAASMSATEQAEFAVERAKVFRPDGCKLHPWSSQRFDDCLAGRKLILIGDSLMRQTFESLGCLLATHAKTGRGGSWGPNYTSVLGEYHGYNRVIHKIHVGDILLLGGGGIHCRCFGHFNSTLWDDVLIEIQDLYGNFTSKDILVVNFGAWYSRIPGDGWRDFRLHMRSLIFERLRHLDMTIFWKEHAPAHFGGHTGAYIWFIPGFMPPSPQCEPASVGETWYDEWIRGAISECGDACKHIRVLPIFNATLPRFKMHHGSVGSNIMTVDCRHYCNPVKDLWSLLLYNAMCFP